MLLRILTFFKWVYGNPLTFLVGIRRIPAYHVDYTTGVPVTNQAKQLIDDLSYTNYTLLQLMLNIYTSLPFRNNPLNT